MIIIILLTTALFITKNYKQRSINGHVKNQTYLNGISVADVYDKPNVTCLAGVYKEMTQNNEQFKVKKYIYYEDGIFQGQPIFDLDIYVSVSTIGSGENIYPVIKY